MNGEILAQDKGERTAWDPFPMASAVRPALTHGNFRYKIGVNDVFVSSLLHFDQSFGKGGGPLFTGNVGA